MPSLQLRLLGQFQILVNGEPAPIYQARLQSLFGYLALHRDVPQMRQHLSFLFWPDSTEAQARANLRRALYALRRILPDLEDFLRIDSRSAQWRNDASFELDVRTFEELLAESERAGQSTVIEPLLEQAVARYAGDLLPGCYDDWVLDERELLRQRYLSTLEKLVHLLEDRREYTMAIAQTQRLVEADPLQESAYRTLMRLHVQNGDRARALRVYHTCATVLQQELGVDPGPEMQAAHQRLLNLDTLPVTQPAPVAPTQKGELLLVGRQGEWAALQSAWHSALQGQPHFVLIAGEAGIGKTKLAEEFLRWAEWQGHGTAKTRSYAAEGRLAYAPVTDWLRAEAIKTHMLQMEKVWLGEVARLLPELLIARPDLSPPQPLADSWQRQRFREALAQALVLDEQPLLLVIDDLQWCDQETLEWLHYLLRFRAQTKLLVVGTVRPEEVAADHPLRTLAMNLRQEGKLLEIELGRLDAEETAALASQVVGHELDPDQSASLYAETEGFPLFVVETIRAHAAGVKSAVATPTLATGLTPKVQAVIGSRLAQLTPSTRALAELAAIVGRAFTVEVLAQASEGDEDALVRGLDELWQRRIVREQGSHAYDFSHDRIRDAVYSDITPARRRLLHRRVAEALECVHATNLEPVSGQIAAHYELADLPENAVVYYQQAADVAQRVYAHAEATHHLNKGLALLRQVPVTPERLRQKLRLLLALGVSLVTLKGTSDPEPKELYEQAYNLAVQVEDELEQLVALAGLHMIEVINGNILAAYEVSQQEMALAQRVGNPSRLMEARVRLGAVLFYLGQLRAIRNSFEQNKAYAEYQWADSSHPIPVLHWGLTGRRQLARDIWHLGYADQALEEMKETLALAEELSHPYNLTATLISYAWLHYYRREAPLARARAASLIVLSQQHGFREWLPEAMAIEGWALVQQGQVQAGIVRIEEGLALNLALKRKFHRPHLLAIVAETYGNAGQPAQGLSLLDEALAQVEATSERASEAELHRLKGELLLMRGADVKEVESQFLQAYAIAQQQEAKSLELRAAMSLCRLWQKQEKRQQAYDLLAEVYGWFSEGFDTSELKDARAILESLA